MNMKNHCTDMCFVSTHAGPVMGYHFKDVYTFKGIPYAKAKRFHLPEKPQPWTEPYPALVYREISPVHMTKVGIAKFVDFTGSDLVENEECQFLNVWTKSIDKTAGKPVIVWLHGGGFDSGASNELAVYDGNNICDEGDIVFVSLNHRLNVLGYLDLSNYGEEYRYSGNAGMADIIMALEWVQDNISEFGGDPSNVTIAGQSGGGGKCWTLMGMPAARGLFNKAVILSGWPVGIPQAEARDKTAAILDKLHINAGNIHDIETVPFYDLGSAAVECEFHAYPVIDGEYYPQMTIHEGNVSDLAKDIPTIITTTMGEMRSTLQGCLVLGYEENHACEWDDETVLMKLRNKFGDAADAMIPAFRQAYPYHDIRDLLYTMKRNNDHALAKAGQNGAPVYQGIFAKNIPVYGGVTPWHTGGDVPYILRNADKIPYIIAGDEDAMLRYQDMTSQMLISFAKDGQPQADDTKWPPFTVEEGKTLVMDEQFYIQPFHDRKLMELWPDIKPSFAFRGKIIPAALFS